MATTITTENGARLAGYTRPLFADSDFHSLSLYVRPDADLDGTFRAFCRDECEMLNVNGWHFDFSDNEAGDE